MALIRLNNQSLSAVTSAGLPSGTVLQVVDSENSYTDQLFGTANTAYTVQSSSGTDWSLDITVNQGSKILIQLNLNVNKGNDDANPYYDLLYQVDGGSFLTLGQGVANGSRSRHTGNIRSYATQYTIEETSCSFLLTPTISGATGVVTFKVNLTQRAGGNRPMNVNFTTAGDVEGGTVTSNMIAMEIAG